jgi:hypothetical protein
LGIAGGMTNGVAYFVIEVASSVPPDIAAKARRMKPNLVSSKDPAPARVLSFRNARLVVMTDSQSRAGS